MQTLEQNMVDGETKRFPCAKHFFLLSAPLGVDLVFLGKHQQSVGSVKGVKGGFSVKFTDYDEATLAVRVVSLGAQAVKFQYSDVADIDYVRSQGDIDDVGRIVNPVSVQGIADPVSVQGVADPVSVIDRDGSLVDENCFFGSTENPQWAGKYATNSLFNPAGSGKVLLLESFIVNSSSSTDYSAFFSSSFLSNSFVSNNKYYGSAVGGVGEPRSEGRTVLSGKWVGRAAGNYNDFVLDIKRAVVIIPGVSFNVSCKTVSTVTNAFMQWREVSV